MTPIKLSTGNTLQNLMYYMFITNEYGKPSTDSIDLFIESFGIILMNGNFSRIITDSIKSKLDTFWEDIKHDLEIRKSCGKYTGGLDWFKKLCSEAFKLKSDTELLNSLSQDKELLKQWIMSIDVDSEISIKDEKDKKDIEKIPEMCYNNDTEDEREDVDMAYRKLDFSITPELVLTDANNNEYIGVMLDCNGSMAFGRLYKDNSLVLLSGSTLDIVKDARCDYMYEVREKYSYAIQNDFDIVQDIKFKTPSGASCLVTGRSSNGWKEWYNEYDKPISVYIVDDKSKEEQPEIANCIDIEISSYGKRKRIWEFVDKTGNEYTLDTTTGEVIVYGEINKYMSNKSFDSIVDFIRQMIDVTSNSQYKDVLFDKAKFKVLIANNLDCKLKNTKVSATALFDWEDNK